MLVMKLPRTTPSLGATPPMVHPNEVISLILLKVPVVLGFAFSLFFPIASTKILDELLYTISSIISRVFGRWSSTLL